MLSADSIDHRGALTMFAIYNPANNSKVESAIKEEFEKLVADGVTADELDQAKTGYLQALEVSRSSDGRLASMLTDNLYAGRTMKYYADLEKKIKDQTPETIHATVKKYFDIKRLVVVVAGTLTAEEKPAEK
jgi:zinc protease